MSPVISFKPFHVYTLRETLTRTSPTKFVLVVSDEFYSNRHFQQIVTVLALSPTPPPVELDIRVQIQSRSSGGTALLPGDHWVVVEGLIPVAKLDLIETSGTPISVREGEEVCEKLKKWLAIY
jgi:hypothetical protein